METILKSGYVCHPQQLYTLRRVRVSEGKAKGTEIIEVSTAGGLQVDILPDAGLDIGQVRYKGTNVTFISKNGYDSPAAMQQHCIMLPAIRMKPKGFAFWWHFRLGQTLINRRSTP